MLSITVMEVFLLQIEQCIYNFLKFIEGFSRTMFIVAERCLPPAQHELVLNSSECCLDSKRKLLGL